jgi:hypothetical protein
LEEKGILFQIAKAKHEIIVDGVVKSQYNVVAWDSSISTLMFSTKTLLHFIVVAKENTSIHTSYLHI